MDRNVVWHKYAWVIFLSIFLAGCAGTPVGQTSSSQAPSTTDMLTQAGFLAEPVKKPEHLQKLPGGQFVTVQRQGRTIYVYTDPNSKQLYFGSEAAYQRFLFPEYNRSKSCRSAAAPGLFPVSHECV